MADPETPEERRLLDVICHDCRFEIFHETDCFACSVAKDVVGQIAPYWDPNELWDEVKAAEGMPGDTLYGQLERMVAYVLHRRLPGHSPAPSRPVGGDRG